MQVDDVIAKMQRSFGDGCHAVLGEREVRLILDRIRELEGAACAVGYEDFLSTKLVLPPPRGLEEELELADHLFPFQRDIVRK